MSDNEREKVWVCVPCGRWHDERDKIGGQECYDNAVYCYLDSCKFGDGGPRVSHIGELVEEATHAE